MAKRRRSSRQRDRGGRFGAMLTGVVVGLLIAAAAWWTLTPADERPTVVTEAPTLVEPTEEPVAATEPDRESRAKPVEIEATGVGYDFYDMLPTQEIVVSDNFRERREGTAKTEKPEALIEPGEYMIQAGSFRNLEGAEQIEALLALQGIRARVEPIDTASGRLHQVRVGPLDVDTVNTYRDRLAAADIDVVVLRVQP